MLILDLIVICLAFCDEEEVSRKYEEQEKQNVARQEMYSEQRKEMMSKQVSSLHQSKQEQVTTTSSISKEALEWQEMARREKSYVEHTETTHSSMVSLIL